MNMDEELIRHLKQFEGKRLKAYKDPGSKNGEPWTVGYGHTSDSFYYVQPNSQITDAMADKLLEHDAAEAQAIVRKLVKVKLSRWQEIALTSFVFNLGEGAFKKSTLLRKLNAGDYASVPGELAKFVYNDGKKMQGLVNRRAAEAGLWAKGSFASSRDVKAAPAGTVKRLIEPDNLVAVGGFIGSLGGVLAGSGPVQYALAGVIVVGFATFLWLQWRKAR